MNSQIATIVGAGALLITAAAAAQAGAHTEYSAHLAAGSRKMSAEGRRAMQKRIDAVDSKFREAHGGQGPDQFGLQCCQITQIPATSFVSTSDGGNWLFLLDGYIGPGPSSAGLLWASVSLPTGAEIAFLDLYYYDSDAVNDLTAELFAYSGGGPLSGPPQTAFLVATAKSSGSSGFGYAPSEQVAYTVNNNVGYDPDAGQLMIRLLPDNFNAANVGFKAVDLWWMRQISAPPATPTFSDVPADHPFFQFVEALAASGVTVGYPDGRFGVDDPITRGQMAVFLAKALGLYWKY